MLMRVQETIVDYNRVPDHQKAPLLRIWLLGHNANGNAPA